jgi:AcrR family transcriptional regulator
MPRQRGFEPDEVLDKAMRLFWRQGYNNTSVQELEEAMGINRFSIYATFESKHDLFLATLERYRDTDLRTLETYLLGTLFGLMVYTKTNTPLAELERYVKAVLTPLD